MPDRLWRKRRADGQPTGSWYGAYFDAEGKRRQVCTRQLDRQAARRVLREIERQAAAPRSSAADATLTVGDALRYLVEESNAKDWAATTLRMFAQKAGHALRLLGTIRLIDLRQGHLVRYCDERLAEGAARETVRKELSTIKAALGEAVKLEWLVTAPTMPRFTVKYRPRDRWLPETEARDLLLALPPLRRRWVMLALYTGCRLSEIERLSWEDVDQVSGRILVRGTKTRGSRRWIALPAPLLDVLTGVPEDERIGAIAGRWANARRDLRDACKRAGIDPVSPNDLRRTYASWLKQRGVDSAAVAKLLGHTSTRMVDLVYGHLSDDTLAAAVAVLPAATGGSALVAASEEKPAPMRRMANAAPTARTDQLAATAATRRSGGVPRGGIEPPTRGFSVRCSTC